MNKILKAKIVERFGTQADFSEAIKMHESDVSRIVRGRKILTLETQRKWASALGCTHQKVFGNGKASR